MQTNGPIVIDHTFKASPEKIWQALTDKDQMKSWYFDLKDFKPEVGFEFQFEGTDGCETFMHLCRVTRANPNKKLAYSWRYEGVPGNSFVTFELFPEGDQTRLRLTHEGLETFPADVPSYARENFVKGWNHIIGTSLKDFLGKTVVENQ